MSGKNGFKTDIFNISEETKFLLDKGGFYEKQKGKRLRKKRRKKLQVTSDNQKSKFDVFGSYTGVCAEDKFEQPVQDADDL